MTHPRPPRSRRPLLIALNLALLALLGGLTWSADAEARQSARARGRYIGVAGGAPGASGDVFWILDTVNREMIALAWDPNTKASVLAGYRDLAIDAAAAMQRGGR